MSWREEIERGLAELPRPELSRDLAPGVVAALRAEAAGRARPTGRRLLARLAWAGGGLTLGLALGIVLSLALGPQAAPAERCRVRQVSGEVSRVAGGQRSAVRAGELLQLQDLVAVGRGARAELDLDPDSRVILHAETRVRLVRLDAGLRGLELDRGRASVELLDTGRRAVQVTHPPSGSLVEGRQGAFDALVLEGGRVAFAVRRGQAELRVGERRQTLEAGTQVRLVPDAPPPSAIPVSDRVGLELDEPAGPLVASDGLAVAGLADTHARVWLNDRQVGLDPRGRFREVVAVRPGERLELLAEDVLGNRRSLVMGPALAVAPAPPKPPAPDLPTGPAARPQPPAEALPPARRLEIRDYQVQW